MSEPNRQENEAKQTEGTANRRAHERFFQKRLFVHTVPLLSAPKSRFFVAAVAIFTGECLTPLVLTPW